jgi:hypothetical protein
LGKEVELDARLNRRQAASGDKPDQDSGRSFFTAVPAVSLPKGGGAIRGIDEKFQVNPATGTVSWPKTPIRQPYRKSGPAILVGYRHELSSHMPDSAGKAVL